MPKKIFKKYMPNPEMLKKQKSLQFLGEKLHDPNFWHLNRRSVSLAFAVGLFVAWVPTPGQMAIAAVIAFYVRANLPISVALVWITNPLTMPPMFYFAYNVGAWALDSNGSNKAIDFSVDTLLNGFGDYGLPFLFGCLIIGVLSALIGYFGINAFWRYHVGQQWLDRLNSRSEK